jgi:hypothetical protein
MSGLHYSGMPQRGDKLTGEFTPCTFKCGQHEPCYGCDPSDYDKEKPMDEYDTLEQEAEAEKQDQIKKIATELHKSGRYDNIPWVEIKADAAMLYGAGFRFDG